MSRARPTRRAPTSPAGPAGACCASSGPCGASSVPAARASTRGPPTTGRTAARLREARGEGDDAGPRPTYRPGLDAAVVPALLLLLARELVEHDPPRVLAWRLLHEPRLLHPPAWLRPFYPDPQASFDRDPIALLLAAFATGLAVAYLAAGLARTSTRIRLALIAAGSLLLVVVPTLAFVALGAATDRPYGQDGGVVQLPLAIEKILRGESPYGADYSETILGRQARASSFWEPLGGNPILRHHAYLPGTHLVMLPGYLVGRRLMGFFDPRFVTLAFYFLAAVLAYFIPVGRDARLTAVGLAALNPLTWWQQVFGANDVVFVAMILLAVLLARQERRVAAGALLGLACATKQLAWPFAPFLLAHLSGARSLRELASVASVRRLAAPLLAAASVFVLVVTPVAALDWRAFYGDIAKYNVGLPGGDNYPLGGTPGFGFANFLIGYGAVTSLKDYFPFGVFYLLLVPLGLLLLARQLRLGRAEAALVTGSAALFASLYFSRVVHANYLIPIAILLPAGVLALRLPADLAVTPLALGALAVTVTEQEVFRASFDEAVAARVPEALAAWARALLPHPAAGLTADPIGLVVSAACGAFGLLVLVAGVLEVRAAWRVGLALVALVVVVALPKDLVTSIGERTGTPRGVDGWVAQVPADAERLAHGQSPYTLPPPERPVAREAWTASFRLDPPAALFPVGPLVPPGSALLSTPGRLDGHYDPRQLSMFMLGLVVVAAASTAGRWAPWAFAVPLLLPLALGAVFGARSLWTAGGLAVVVVLARRGRTRAAAVAFGVTVALDHTALVAAPLLALGSEHPRPVSRLLGWAALGYAVMVLPVALLGPRAFVSAFTPRFEAGPGFGLTNILLYGGSVPRGVAILLWIGTSLVAVVGVLAVRRMAPASAIPLAACLSVAALWLHPAPAVGALAVPLVLLVLAAPSFASREEPKAP